MAGKLEKSKTELVAVVVVVVVLPCTECRDTGAGALHGGGHPDVLVVLLLGLLLLELGGEGEGVPVGEPLGELLGKPLDEPLGDEEVEHIVLADQPWLNTFVSLLPLLECPQERCAQEVRGALGVGVQLLSGVVSLLFLSSMTITLEEGVGNIIIHIVSSGG